jgi:hypothetical protein
MSYVIRAALPSDESQLSDLQAQVDSRILAKKRVDQPARSDALTLVCDDHGTLLGFVTATVNPALPLAGRENTIWNIVEFCVPDVNAQGHVGSALLEEIGRKAQESAGYVVSVW